jgi:hypothetical protein
MENAERPNRLNSAVYAILGICPHNPARDGGQLTTAEVKARVEAALPRVISLLDEMVGPRERLDRLVDLLACRPCVALLSTEQQRDLWHELALRLIHPTLPTTRTGTTLCRKCSRLAKTERPVFCAWCAEANWTRSFEGLQNFAWLDWQFIRERRRRAREVYGIRPAVLDKRTAKRRPTGYIQGSTATKHPLDKRELSAAYKDAGIEHARYVRPEMEVLIAADPNSRGDEVVRNPDQAATMMDRQRRTGQKVFEDQILFTETQAGQPGVETITREQYGRDPQAGRAESPPPPLTLDDLPGSDFDDTDDDETIEELSATDLIPDDVSDSVAQVDGEDAPANWELARELTPFDQLRNTGLCTECGTRPAEAKGICSRCRKRAERARLREAGQPPSRPERHFRI